MIPYRVISFGERADMVGRAHWLYAEGWPAFIRHGSPVLQHWERLYSTFAPHQLTLCDEQDNLMAVGFTIPFGWNGESAGLPTGWDELLRRAVEGHDAGHEATALAALAAFVNEPFRGHGVSQALLRELVAHARRHALGSLLVPVRPTLKSRYPLTPIEQYVTWQTEGGTPFDPWMRTHWRLGAQVLGVAPRSKVRSGSVAEWERWAAMRFPASGRYVVPDALQPIEIDIERDEGRYEEPNVWMRHATT